MGMIQKRPSGNYTAKVRKHGYPPQSKTFLNKTDARRWLTETEAAMSRACFIDTSVAKRTLFREVIARYILEVSPTHRGGFIEAVRLGAIQRDPIAAYSLAALSPRSICEWRDRRLRTVSGSTVNRELNLLHAVIEAARKDWGIGLLGNPVSEVRRPRSSPGRERRLTDAEEIVLLEECKKARSWWLLPVVELAINTAMRQSEVRTLLWENIDRKDRVATLPAAGTKTLTTRTVPLNKRSAAIIDAIWLTQGKPAAGEVFPGLTRNALKMAFARARKRAGISDFRFHDTRHEATSRLVELGLSDAAVASVTGHKTRAMLARYTHLRAKDLVPRLDKMPDKDQTLNIDAARELIRQLRKLCGDNEN